MLTFLLVIQAIVAVLLVGVILMQQSEGGGLGMGGGGSPGGLMSARGAADFLTRSTTILAAIFIGLSILHAVLATQTNRGGGDIDTSLAKRTAPALPAAPAPGVPAPTTGVPAPATVPLANTPPVVPIATAQQKVQPREQRPVQQRQQTTPLTAPRPQTTTTPPPVATTVTPSIPRAAPAEAPVPTVQGPPANSN